jgi:hypothetical protein
MATALLIAAKAVGSALAVSSQGIQIVSLDPFKITPPNAFDRPFSDFNTVMDIFRAHLIENLPDVISGEIEALPMDNGTIIMRIVDAVQAILLQ